MNSKLTQQQKNKWLAVIANDIMSSEESGPDDDSILVHSLPWRTQYVTKMFGKIDQYTRSKKSPQALRQMKKRVIGATSNRPRPVPIEKFPEWAVEA